jgi:hypothetical protein
MGVLGECLCNLGISEWYINYVCQPITIHLPFLSFNYFISLINLIIATYLCDYDKPMAGRSSGRLVTVR